jgi:hypothetical protein
MHEYQQSYDISGYFPIIEEIKIDVRCCEAFHQRAANGLKFLIALFFGMPLAANY